VEEPHWIDLRKLRPSERPGDPDAVERPRLGDIVAEFAAPIRGEDKDSLVGDHIRYQRRIRRLIQIVITSLATLLVAAVAAGLFAAMQANRATTALATSDFRQGSQLVENRETADDGIAYLARAAEAGDTRAQTRLWTMLQQRSFWLPVSAEVETPPADEPAVPAVPQQVLDRFSSVEVDGSLQTAQNVAISGDGKRVFTAVGDIVNDVPALIKVWNVDGTAVTDWWEPPYSGNFYLYRIRGYLNETGDYLAVELEGWRETAELVVYDVETMQEFQADITASGLLPQTQSIGYNAVQFVERPARGATGERTFLVTASAKGDAIVYALQDGRFNEVARNSHRSAVGVASIDADDQWLMSAGADGTISISSLDNSRTVGNLIYADPTVTAVRRIGASRLLIETDGGKWTAYDLKSPVRRETVEVPPLETEGSGQEPCLRLFDLYGEPETRLEHPSGLVITAEANRRRVSVARAGEAPRLSPIFAADIDVVCGSADGSIVTVTTANFRTEIWRWDFTERRGVALDERPYFAGGWTPEKTDWVALSPDGQRALIRSSFWDPPNVEVFWISLWDVQSGLPLMDRTEFGYDGLTDGVVLSARFATGGHLTFIGDEALAPRSLELVPPAPLRETLPQYAEAIVDRRINAQGLAERIPDRSGRLASGKDLLESMN